MRFKILIILFLLLFLSVAIYFAVTQIDYIKSDTINSAMEKIQETSESGLNNPVMKSKVDNNFYLTHVPDGRSNELGAIYLDVFNEIDSPSTNFILYGHNFRDGSMFLAL